MATEAIAKRIFKRARALYESGFKSANKKYDDNPVHVSWWKRLTGKALTRNEGQQVAQVVLPALRGDAPAGILAKGKYLYDSQVAAANCGDLANLSCYLGVLETVPPAQLGVAGVYTKKVMRTRRARTTPLPCTATPTIC
jgi:hypothetical protein